MAARRVAAAFPPDTIAIGDAYATLERGAAYVGRLRGWDDRDASMRQQIARARYLGNCLRELDRFLAVLLDACQPLPPARLLTLRRDTASRIADHIGASLDLEIAQTRLRALDRSRTCLLYDGGCVSRADAPQVRWMTAGWHDAGRVTLQRYGMGARLRPTAGHLHDIARFYGRLGNEVAAGSSPLHRN